MPVWRPPAYTYFIEQTTYQDLQPEPDAGGDPDATVSIPIKMPTKFPYVKLVIRAEIYSGSATDITVGFSKVTSPSYFNYVYLHADGSSTITSSNASDWIPITVHNGDYYERHLIEIVIVKDMMNEAWHGHAFTVIHTGSSIDEPTPVRAIRRIGFGIKFTSPVRSIEFYKTTSGTVQMRYRVAIYTFCQD